MSEKLALDIYAKISATTSQMLAAAQEQDWDLLCELEASCSDYTEKLKSLQVGKLTTETMSNKKINYIKAILENDRQIREIVSPWMRKLNGLIQHSSTEKKLNKAYHQ
jgi:flagellar protein FliT